MPSTLSLLFCTGFKRFHLWLRLASYRGWASLPCRFFYRRIRRKYNIQISPTTKIGYGLYLGHQTSVVFSPSTIIGNNCNFSQFTTIGSNSLNAAVFGNNVYSAPSVCYVENVHIGSGAAVGAGSVVTRNVEAGTTVAGVPAKKISDKGHPEFIANRWPID